PKLKIENWKLKIARAAYPDRVFNFQFSIFNFEFMTQHASSSSQPAVAEPTYAEQVRTLLWRERVGALATQSLRHPGWPFASVMPYALTAGGAPFFLISSMAIH